MKRLVALCSLLALTGCVVYPNIDQKLLTDPGRKGDWIPYQLTDTTIVVGVSAQANSQATKTPLVTAADATTAAAKAPAAAAAPVAAVVGAPPKAPAKGKAKATATAAVQPPASGAAGGAASGGATGTSSAGSATAGAGSQTASQDSLPSPVKHWPVELSAQDVTCQDDRCNALVGATAVPISYDAKTFAIAPTYHDFVRTFVSPTYYPNTLRLKTLEFSIVDNRQQTVDAAVDAVGAVRQLNGALTRSGGPKVTVHLPIVIDLADAKKPAADNKFGFKPLPNNDGLWYRLEFLDDPESAGFIKQARMSQEHGAVLTSLCRRANFEISSVNPAKYAQLDPSADGKLAEGETKLIMSVTVADPDYLLPVPLPLKGSVSFASLCGADVRMDTATLVSVDQVVQDFESRVNAMR